MLIKIRNWFILSVLTFFCFLLPGFLFGIISDYNFRIEVAFLSIFIPAAMILALVKPVIISVVILVLFMIMEIIQFSNIFYFGVPLSPFSVDLLLKESKEVLESASMVFPDGLYHVIIILVSYIGLIFIYYKSRKVISKSYIATALIIIFLSILPYKALVKTPKIANFMPRNDRVSIYNSMMSFNGYLFLILPSDKYNQTSYLPYKTNIDSTNINNRNIVLILGESVNSNHIGLLGYSRDTTPKLSKMSQNDKNFVAKHALSSSVLTRNSMSMLFNVTYEHNNIKHISMQETNLVKLAKLAGFKVFYISNQTEAELSALASNHIDILTTKENYIFESEKIGDMVLLDEIKKYKNDFSDGKNFIIIHQRNAHSPYEKGYRGYDEAGVFPISNIDFNEYKINSYDNSMIFNDHIISNLFGFFKEIKANPSYVMFFPDHGEAMGENDKWGHAFLDTSVVNIPLFASLYNAEDKQYIKSLQNLFYPTHYELGILMTNLMGVEIVNPNFKDNIFYINGVDLSGNAGYIEIKKDKKADKIEFVQYN